MENKDVITVFEDTMTRTHIVMASIMYTFAVIPFLGWIYFILKYDVGLVDALHLLAYVISIITPFIVPAINISEENIVRVNLSQNQLITEQRIVFYEKVKITNVTIFDYVALNSSGFGYTVTLWYQYNGYRHERLVTFYKKDKAFAYGKSLCRVLNVDLLNKIDINKPIWIDKSEL